MKVEWFGGPFDGKTETYTGIPPKEHRTPVVTEPGKELLWITYRFERRADLKAAYIFEPPRPARKPPQH